MPGRIDLEFKLGTSTGQRRAAKPIGERLRILVLADFSGRDDRGLANATDLGSRPIVKVDLDNFDAALRAFAPSLQPGGALGPEPLALRSLDDFHPDTLHGRLAAFGALREAATADDPGSLLEKLIGAPAPVAPVSRAGGSVVDNLVRKLVQPQVAAPPAAPSAAAVAALDAAATDLMRSLLHSPAFQRLESAWRGVRRFVESVEIGDEVELHLLDVSKAELHADLVAAAGDVAASNLGRRLSQSRLAGIERPWGLLVGQFRVGANAEDLELLQHLGLVAAYASGPLLLDAAPSLAGCEHLSEHADPREWMIADADIAAGWQALRRNPAAAEWIGLALPRVLLRLPYGRKTDPIESFGFEEATDSHESLLWGSAALACAQAIALAFIEQADALRLDGAVDIDDLPAYVRVRDGEKQLQPCAEFRLPVQVGEALLQRGFIPLLSFGNRASVRIVALQSIAEPRRGLAGFA